MHQFYYIGLPQKVLKEGAALLPGDRVCARVTALTGCEILMLCVEPELLRSSASKKQRNIKGSYP